MMEDVLAGLNEEQLNAVTTTEGYVRVIAGAGSGKTKALTHRFAYLVKELGVSTQNIVCITFTNKAANEMKKRIQKMLGDEDMGYICTFHGMGVKILREDIHVINYPKNFNIMDEEDTEAVLKVIYENLGITTSTISFDMMKKRITDYKYKNNYVEYLQMLDNKELREKCTNENDVYKKIIYSYLYEQKKNYALDYEDLLLIPLYIFDANEEKRIKWQKRCMYVMVDEFQDVSLSNYQFAQILSDYHKNLFVVGDPDQTIYSWRGASIGHILEFDKVYPTAKTIKLFKNYRSSPEILGLANSLISKNKKRIPNELVAHKESNVLTVYNHSKTVYDEAEWVANQIETLVNNGIKYNEIAILYRAHYISRAIEEKIIAKKIPYVIYSGIEFYKRQEIKDAIAYLKMIVHKDDMSFRRIVNVPKRFIGKKRMEFLTEYAEDNEVSLYQALESNLDHELFSSTGANDFYKMIEHYSNDYKNMKVSDVVTNLLNDSGYEEMLRVAGEDERIENLAELKYSIFEFEKNSGEENVLEDYLQTISMFTNSDNETRADSIKLMTIHTSKGLEFPYVFVCGLNEGIFPSSKIKTINELEEERRLAYVAFTRAENALFLTDAEGVNYSGSYRYPSRFIFNIEKEYLRYNMELDETLISNTQEFIKNNEDQIFATEKNSDLKVGDVVEHRAFGRGIIKEIDEEEGCIVIKFDEIETERRLNKRVVLSKVNDDK